jgi:outer membrane biosynthesis protein TonB
MGVAAVFAAVVTADGHNFQLGSEIGLTLLAFATAAGLAAFAVGLYRGRPWSRTPVAITQLFVGGYGLYLVTHHRIGWGVPALLVAVGCLAALFTPASMQALNRPAPPQPPEDQPANSQPTKVQPTKVQPTKVQPTKVQPTKVQPAKVQPAKVQPAKRQPAKRQPAKKAAR